MAQNVTINGVDYPAVPGISVPLTSGSGNALYLDAAAYRTAVAQDAIDAGKADKPTVKTVMDAVPATATQYYLGVQSAVSITMPTDAELGQEIKVFFKSGATACTLTCDLTGFDYVPKANTAVLLTFRLVHKADAQLTSDEDEWTVQVEEG